MNLRLLSLCCVLIGLVACGDHDHPHDAKPATAAASEPVTNRIPIPATVRSNLGITFATVEFRRVAATRRYPGRFEADADARRDYRAPISGIVDVLTSPYQSIAVGAPVARISGRGWAELQRDWLESRMPQADTALAAAFAQRRTLLTAQVAAAAGLAVDDPGLESLTTAASLTIHARSAGIVEADIAVAGSMVEVGAPLLKTVDSTRVRLRAQAPQGDLAQVMHAPTARILPTVDGWSAAIPARFAFGTEADSTLRTQDLIAWPLASDASSLPAWARPGIGAVLEIETASGEGELAIPVSATIRDGLDTIIFRRDPANPDQVIRLVADLGISDGTWVEVLSGVAKGDQVVVDGIYQLKLSGAGKSQLGGHFHADGSFHAEADDAGK